MDYRAIISSASVSRDVLFASTVRIPMDHLYRNDERCSVKLGRVPQRINVALLLPKQWVTVDPAVMQSWRDKLAPQPLRTIITAMWDQYFPMTGEVLHSIASFILEPEANRACTSYIWNPSGKMTLAIPVDWRAVWNELAARPENQGVRRDDVFAGLQRAVNAPLEGL